jgi:hypothetical protein
MHIKVDHDQSHDLAITKDGHEWWQQAEITGSTREDAQHSAHLQAYRTGNLTPSCLSNQNIGEEIAEN